MKQKPVTGILWWKPKQWERAKQISSDSHVFDDTFEEWKESADQALKNFHALGVTAVKIEIDLDELVEWCKKQKLPLNAKARARFVSMKVRDRFEGNSE